MVLKPELTLTDEDKLGLLKLGYSDPVYFCRTFLPNWFPQDMPWVHRGILAIMRRQTEFLKKYGELDKIFSNFLYAENPTDPKSKMLPIFSYAEDGSIQMAVGKNTLLIIPRGFSKTTLCNACTIMDTVYQDKDMLMYIGETGPHAQNQLRSCRMQFEDNLLLQTVFGNLQPGRQDSEKWRDDQLETNTNVVLIARGRGGQVRGTNVGGRRPKKIICDDLEDEESVSTDEQRKKCAKWFWGAVVPALAKLDPDASLTVLGTVLHEDALIMNLAKSPEFTTIKFGALDLQGEPLWKENISLEGLERLKEQYSRQGQLDVFYREYMSTIRNDESAKFKSNYIRHRSIDSGIVGRALVLDPAISEKKQADFSAFAVVSMAENGYIEVTEHIMEKALTPRQQIDMFFELSLRYGKLGMPPLLRGIESIAYQKALVHLMKEEMFRKQHYFDIAEIQHGAQNKILRVEGILQPRYAAGYIFHRIAFPLLEQQLLDWPNGKKDGPDAVAMAVSLLDPFAAAAATGGFEQLTGNTYESMASLRGGHGSINRNKRAAGGCP